MKYRFHPKDVDLFVIATDSSVPAAHRFCTNTSHKHLLVQLQGLHSPLKSYMPALQWFLFCQNSYIPSSHYNSLLNTHTHPSMAFPIQSFKYFHSLPTKLYKWSGPSQQHLNLDQFLLYFIFSCYDKAIWLKQFRREVGLFQLILVIGPFLSRDTTTKATLII